MSATHSKEKRKTTGGLIERGTKNMEKGDLGNDDWRDREACRRGHNRGFVMM